MPLFTSYIWILYNDYNYMRLSLHSLIGTVLEDGSAEVGRNISFTVFFLSKICIVEHLAMNGTFLCAYDYRRAEKSYRLFLQESGSISTHST